MKTLTLSTGSFDQVNTFTIAEVRYSRCKLMKDKEVAGDGILWVLQCAGCLKASYSDADRAEMARLNSGESTVRNGEVVLVDGKQYRVRVLGNYSDCAVLDPVSKPARKRTRTSEPLTLTESRDAADMDAYERDRARYYAGK
jgi:hypothetical protein